MKLEDLFYYDITSPSGLRRKTDWRCGPKGSTLRACAGDVVGGLHPRGYYKIRVNGTSMSAHSIIWQLHNGSLPEGWIVDHIDGNTTNNDINNLRAISIQHNSQNRKMRNDNSLGITGISERFDGSYHRFLVRCSNLDGSRHHKNFSVHQYGREQALKLAIEYREEYIKKLNEQGACYTERHGKPKEEANVNTSNS